MPPTSMPASFLSHLRYLSSLLVLPVLIGCPYINDEQSDQALDPDGDGAPWYEVYEEWGVHFGQSGDCIEIDAATLGLGDTFTVDAYVKAGIGGTTSADLFPLLVLPGAFALTQEAGHTVVGPAKQPELDDEGVSIRGFMDGAYHHLAAVYGMSGYLSVYLDGNLLSHYQVALPDAEGTTLYVGCWPEREASFLGTIGELRIVDAAIYSGDFEPAWQPYADDANVIALWHMDEGEGSSITNAAGDMVGTLVGAGWEHFDLACLDEQLDCGPYPVDYADDDRDGFAADEDCDDDDAHVYPGAGEACDDLDNDCDGLLDGEDPEAEAECGGEGR
jgi:hypothetical protein